MNFGIAILKYLKVFNKENKLNWSLRVGMASGNCVAGIIGKNKWQYDVWGACINNASRMETLGLSNRITIARSTYEYVFDKFEFHEKTVTVQGIGVVKAYVYTLPENGNVLPDVGDSVVVEIEEKPVKKSVSIKVDETKNIIVKEEDKIEKELEELETKFKTTVEKKKED